MAYVAGSTVNAGNGNNVVSVAAGAATVITGTGNDTVYYNDQATFQDAGGTDVLVVKDGFTAASVDASIVTILVNVSMIVISYSCI